MHHIGNLDTPLDPGVEYPSSAVTGGVRLAVEEGKSVVLQLALEVVGRFEIEGHLQPFV